MHGIAIARRSTAATMVARSRAIHLRPNLDAAEMRNGVSEFIAQSRIEPAIENVGDDASRHYQHAPENHARCQQRIIAAANRVHDHGAHSRPPKYLFDEDGTGEESG